MPSVRTSHSPDGPAVRRDDFIRGKHRRWRVAPISAPPRRPHSPFEPQEPALKADTSPFRFSARSSKRKTACLIGWQKWSNIGEPMANPRSINSVFISQLWGRRRPCSLDKGRWKLACR